MIIQTAKYFCAAHFTLPPGIRLASRTAIPANHKVVFKRWSREEKGFRIGQGDRLIVAMTTKLAKLTSPLPPPPPLVMGHHASSWESVATDLWARPQVTDTLRRMTNHRLLRREWPAAHGSAH
ncbi:hypothetical protein N1851_006400 [Merluccius polli]|uniref:Uncharacterized protein n=1 Tax=Merluccius polli TaxID=89951 RepID=A0AA47N5R3_MERPO|nr:hypothetical protein N1851_006400 [Merluccius polli]